MIRSKCGRCGLVNASTDETCRRCREPLNHDEPINDDEIGSEEIVVKKPRGLLKRVIWVVSTTVFILLIAYLSMLLTSEDLRYDQREVVDRAIAVLESKGFAKQAFLLKRVSRFRATDSWWNRYLGHRDAYAATNFPFEIVTLYPEFFETTTDDVERAAVLFHEAEHLLGSGEEAALETTWRSKTKLGWVEANYAESRVWNNTKDLTQRLIPNLFTCGADGKSDCTE